MAGKYDTSFTESEALLAIAADDHEHAERMVKGMLPGERRELMKACDDLSALCWNMNRSED